MGDTPKWMIYFMEKPSYKWMICGYPHDLGNLQMAEETRHLRVLCFLLPLRHRLPQEFVCGVGAFRVEPVLPKTGPDLKGKKRKGGGQTHWGDSNTPKS